MYVLFCTCLYIKYERWYIPGYDPLHLRSAHVLPLPPEGVPLPVLQTQPVRVVR